MVVALGCVCRWLCRRTRTRAWCVTEGVGERRGRQSGRLGASPAREGTHVTAAGQVVRRLTKQRRRSLVDQAAIFVARLRTLCLYQTLPELLTICPYKDSFSDDLRDFSARYLWVIVDTEEYPFYIVGNQRIEYCVYHNVRTQK